MWDRSRLPDGIWKMSTDWTASGGGWGSVTPSVAWREQPAPLQRYALNGATMGTRYSAIFFAPAGLETAAIGAALQATVDAVDQQMSTWKPDSDLCRFNRSPPGEWIALPDELLAVVAAALEVEMQSGGAFDAGVGDVVDAWGFGPAGKEPDAASIATLAKRPLQRTAETVELDRPARRARRLAPVSLDLSGIAKGFGVDQLARCLVRHGIDRYLVSIDGEIRAGNPKPDGAPWAVAVERPDRHARDAAGVIELTDRAIATSGDYRHWVDVGGTTVSHTMDPRTGRPLANRLASVSVLAEDCILADAWATALMVLGEVDGPNLASERGIDALFMVREGSGLREIGTGGFTAG